MWSAAPDVRRAFEQFLQLEAAGWKGRRGSALACDIAEAAFAREMIAALAERGDASIHALCVEAKPVSMQVVLRCGTAAFTWKTAYDESMREFSPGMLLLEDYTMAFLGDDSITRVDSCAYDDSGFMSAWSERETIAQVWIDARRGRSLSLGMLHSVQKGFLNLRSMVKRIYLSRRRNGSANGVRA